MKIQTNKTLRSTFRIETIDFFQAEIKLYYKALRCVIKADKSDEHFRGGFWVLNIGNMQEIKSYVYSFNDKFFDNIFDKLTFTVRFNKNRS